MPHTRCQL